jgi:hypothetical protein
MLFEQRVPAREFAETELDPFTAEATAGNGDMTKGDKI